MSILSKRLQLQSVPFVGNPERSREFVQACASDLQRKFPAFAYRLSGDTWNNAGERVEVAKSARRSA